MHQTITTTTVTKEVTTTGGLTHHHHDNHHQIKQGHVLHNHPVGTFTFRPIQGKFLHDKDLIGKMDPYCKIKIGWHSGKSSVAKSQGTHPTWSDAIVLNRKHGEQFARLKVKDRDRLRMDDRLGQVKINLDDVVARGKVTQWFTLHKGDKVTGEILVDIEYHPNLV